MRSGHNHRVAWFKNPLRCFRTVDSHRSRDGTVAPVDRLRAMATFVRVVETGSFSAAARHLNIRQPAVSKGMAQLEERLGVRLLMRSTHCLTPTEAGNTFYAHACRAIEQVDEAECAARGTHAALTGSLRVSASVTFGKLHILPHLPLFLRAHPNLSIDLVLDDRVIDLIGEGVDVGLSSDPLPSSSLAASRLATSHRLVLGAPGYFERAGIPATPADLSGHAAVIYTRDPGGTDTWRFCQRDSDISVSLSDRLRVSSSEGVRVAVLGGLGLAVAPRWMFAAELAQGAVRPVLAEWSLPATSIWAVFPTGRKASAKARAFATFVATELRNGMFSCEMEADARG
jgi:DNA-binding transcriptional LysR family regulator